jgi:ATP-dependent helicase YprA (DUF1998 family)
MTKEHAQDWTMEYDVIVFSSVSRDSTSRITGGKKHGAFLFTRPMPALEAGQNTRAVVAHVNLRACRYG